MIGQLDAKIPSCFQTFLSSIICEININLLFSLLSFDSMNFSFDVISYIYLK